MSAADQFDLENLRADGEMIGPAIQAASNRLPRPRNKEKFLAGPIPWNWIIQAGRLPGCALHIGIVLWREAKMKRNRTVKFCLAHLGEFEKSIDTARRGLRALESDRLVAVRHSPGKCPDVTILDANDQEAPSSD